MYLMTMVMIRAQHYARSICASTDQTCLQIIGYKVMGSAFVGGDGSGKVVLWCCLLLRVLLSLDLGFHILDQAMEELKVPSKSSYSVASEGYLELFRAMFD